jgi:hypothetical protein
MGSVVKNQTGGRPQFVTGAEYYWRATLTDLVEAQLRLGNRGLSPVAPLFTDKFLDT